MTDVPPRAEIPVTIPDDEPIVATDVLPLVHTPPPASVRVMVAPGHTTPGPDIGLGIGFTVSTVDVTQPPAVVYVMVVVAAMPLPVTSAFTTPDVDPIVATAVLELVHVPPVTPLVRVVVAPSHSAVVPLMAVGAGFTVTIFDAVQPVTGSV
jgi:hypothetical protein